MGIHLAMLLFMLLHIPPLSMSGLLETAARSIAERLGTAKYRVTTRVTTHAFYPPRAVGGLMTKAAMASIPVVVDTALLASAFARAART